MNRRSLVAGVAAVFALRVKLIAAQGATPTASPAATPQAPDHASLREGMYPTIYDPRNIFTRPWLLEPFSVVGTVTSLEIAPPGYGWDTGKEDSGWLLFETVDPPPFFRTEMIIEVALPNDETDNLMVGYDDDPENVFEGDRVRVSGEMVGWWSGETIAGFSHTWPVMHAASINLVEGR